MPAIKKKTQINNKTNKPLKKGWRTLDMKFFKNMKCPGKELLHIIEDCETCKPSEMVMPQFSFWLKRNGYEQDQRGYYMSHMP